MGKIVLTAMIAAATLGLGAPHASAEPVSASVDPAAASGAQADPAEKLNRKGYAIHQFLDRVFLRPAAMAYLKITPKPVRVGIENVLSNLSEPVVAINDLLQGRVKKAGGTTVRFVANSTFGVGGLIDVAKKGGLPHHDNGFALTLGRAGVKPGPYLFIPLMGPSTVRDAIGNGVDIVTNPFHWIQGRSADTFIIAKTVVGGLDTRASVDSELTALTADATDPYATLRSVYLQNQQSQIDDNGSGPSTAPALPDFDDSPPPPPAGAAPATASPEKSAS